MAYQLPSIQRSYRKAAKATTVCAVLACMLAASATFTGCKTVSTAPRHTQEAIPVYQMDPATHAPVKRNGQRIVTGFYFPAKDKTILAKKPVPENKIAQLEFGQEVDASFLKQIENTTVRMAKGIRNLGVKAWNGTKKLYEKSTRPHFGAKSQNNQTPSP